MLLNYLTAFFRCYYTHTHKKCSYGMGAIHKNKIQGHNLIELVFVWYAYKHFFVVVSSKGCPWHLRRSIFRRMMRVHERLAVCVNPPYVYEYATTVNAHVQLVEFSYHMIPGTAVQLSIVLRRSHKNNKAYTICFECCLSCWCWLVSFTRFLHLRILEMAVG